ncbi:helix-turn-helix domain-containing protein [Pseudomonas sp. Fl5BN2]|uniref:AraC family transcriptional regulator n=1 Tax=unclassified Pseudomonas TaxID=196821 RepID=UPI001378C2C0|nr:helix-turn-helix domain-containing protein [Pseudomonas sp. Fl5BN2]NBF11607.1 helix-turn-helix domain-containing protein [Pseudomonas sp. Fl4BN1]
MDPLSDVISKLKPRSSRTVHFEMREDIAVGFPGYEGLKIYLVTRGQCYLSIDGIEGTHLIQQGDCFLLANGQPFIIADNLQSPVIECNRLYTQATEKASVFSNGGDDLAFTGCRFDFHNNEAKGFLKALPEFIIIRREDENLPVLKWSLEMFKNEIGKDSPGGGLIIEHVTHIILIEILRAHLAAQQTVRGMGWLYAITDKHLSLALNAIHCAPEKKWNLQALAKLAGMSRSAFAQKFKQVTDYTPIEYIRVWKIQLAMERLSNTRDSISTIAFALGYASESAFSTAFKGVTGYAPSKHAEKTAALGCSLGRR